MASVGQEYTRRWGGGLSLMQLVWSLNWQLKGWGPESSEGSPTEMPRTRTRKTPAGELIELLSLSLQHGGFSVAGLPTEHLRSQQGQARWQL